MSLAREARASVALDGETHPVAHLHHMTSVGEPYGVGGRLMTATQCRDCGHAGPERKA